jgi:hypothetical protein
MWEEFSGRDDERHHTKCNKVIAAQQGHTTQPKHIMLGGQRQWQQQEGAWPAATRNSMEGEAQQRKTAAAPQQQPLDH